ncbi:MAG: hypothetical protein HFH89_09610 [Lachnospiraceae bacterium]|nr:hypothetical protein [Lachnospiraceae bacterium]
MKIQDMCKYEKDIKKYSVRLQDAGTGESGSGFVLAYHESKYVYIFTALHVVLGTLTKVGRDLNGDWNGSHFVCKGNEIEYCTLYQELDEGYLEYKTEEEIKEIVYKIDADVRNDNKKRNKDIAVLRIHKEKFSYDSIFEEKLYCIEEEMLSDDFPFIGIGFPNGKDIALKLEGRSKRWNKSNKLRDCQAVGMDSEFLEKMKGFSGTGLVTDYMGRLIFAGLVVSCDYDERHQIFYAVGTSEIVSKMKTKGWEAPKLYGKGMPPENFLEKVCCFEDDLEYMELPVKRGLTGIFVEIDKENKPNILAEKEPFYDIPKCTSERIACPIYWKGRYWILYIYRAVRNLMEGNQYININGDKLKIGYICTEGDGQAEISAVIASAIRKNILGQQIKGNCILVWQSEKNPDRMIFQKRKFKNIVQSIAESSESVKLKMAGYDLLDGEMKTKNYGIFHIKYLLEQLDQCQSMDEVNVRVGEVLEYVWQ